MPPKTDLSHPLPQTTSETVGTPFAMNSDRFEYPFPQTASSASACSATSSSSHASMVQSTTHHPPPPPLLAAGGPFMKSSTCGSISTFGLFSSPEFAGSSYTTSTTGSFSTSTTSPTTTTTTTTSKGPKPTYAHRLKLKLKEQAANARVPPRLQKSGAKWSLSLKRPRKDSGGESGPSSPIPESKLGSLDHNVFTGGIGTGTQVDGSLPGPSAEEVTP